MNINLTLFGQMITFLLFVWFTKRFVWPPMMKALKERQAKIADGLAAAEKGHLELQQAHEKIAADLKQAKDDASNIIVSAKKQADSIIDEARQQAHDEGQRIIQQAQSELDRLTMDAKETLRQQVATLALLGAEKILEQSIDLNMHHQMLDKLVEEI